MDRRTTTTPTTTTDGEWSQYLTLSLRLRWAKKKVAQEGNIRSPAKQLAESILYSEKNSKLPSQMFLPYVSSYAYIVNTNTFFVWSFFFFFQMFLIDWKYKSSKSNEESKLGHGSQRPKLEFTRAFMPVLITSNFDDDSIKDEHASIETPFTH